MTVGQVHVEQQEVDVRVGREVSHRLAGRACHPGQLEPVEAADVLRVRLRSQLLVLDDEHPNVDASSLAPPGRDDREAGAAEPGGVDGDRAPVAARHLTDQGQADAATTAGLARPTSLQHALGVLRRAPRSRCPRRRWSTPSASPSTCTTIRRSVCSATASMALSTRLPTTVTSSRGRTVSSSATTSPPTTRSMPRSAASAVLPSSRAARTGSWTAPTTWSVSTCASLSSSVAKSTACSARPISIRDTTVCSRLAASWFCARSDSVSPRTRSSSPVTAWSSVRSRSVTTAPTSASRQ